MPLDQAARRLRRHLQERLGDGLRGVVIYERDSNTVLFLREDLRETAVEERITPTIEEARAVHGTLATITDERPAFGGAEVNISLFEAVVLMQFFYDEESGVVATLERDVARGIAEFTADCLEVLQASPTDDGPGD